MLLVCTANVCRSPMAAALLTRHLRHAGADMRIHSAGLLEGGFPPAPDAVAAMRARGMDTSAHLSRRLEAADLATADLVIAMGRRHARQAVLALPSCWPRTFTLKDLVRRAEAIGPRRPGQDLGVWLAAAGEGRTRAHLLGETAEDDVEDPTGGSPEAYERVAAELDDLTGRLAALAFAGAAGGRGSGDGAELTAVRPLP